MNINTIPNDEYEVNDFETCDAEGRWFDNIVAVVNDGEVTVLSAVTGLEETDTRPWEPWVPATAEQLAELAADPSLAEEIVRAYEYSRPDPDEYPLR